MTTLFLRGLILTVLSFGTTVAYIAPAQASDEARLTQFYQLLFAQGCKKHPDYIPGRNKHWLAEAGFDEDEFPELIFLLEVRKALIFDDGFIVGQLGECKP